MEPSWQLHEKARAVAGENSATLEPFLSLLNASSCPPPPCPFEECCFWILGRKACLDLVWCGLVFSPLCVLLSFLPVGHVCWAPSSKETPNRLLQKLDAFVPASDGSGSLFAFVSGH